MTEVHQDLLEDEDWPGAAQHGQGLAREQAEHAARQQVAQEGLQHSLASDMLAMFGIESTIQLGQASANPQTCA